MSFSFRLRSSRPLFSASRSFFTSSRIQSANVSPLASLRFRLSDRLSLIRQLSGRARPPSYRASVYGNQKPNFLDRIPEDYVYWGIVAINGVVFAAWFMAGQKARFEADVKPLRWMHDNFTSSWRNFSEGRVWTLLTSAFSHQSPSHIFMNGFTFMFLSKPILEMLGSRRFLGLYLGSAILSSVASMGWQNLVKKRDIGSLGASAAIYSVVSLLACVAPRMTFMIYGIIPVPAWLAVTGIFAIDSYSAVHDKQRGTDTAGHVAGLASGIGYYLAKRFRIF
ncbi:rhomboid-domain-containing protein [Dendrothele bispora CBS 962.96]|uniref:Rhomboid-domain-containing protein n=1 Tax=Dendrothele bispora (strain CBS 962.96) TaxID=1314807 RepID=A0A4S8MM45_DENBC|nr:rhomboid-domain-containing protein [Dendrothele bispora CBS 962.96]